MLFTQLQNRAAGVTPARVTPSILSISQRSPGRVRDVQTLKRQSADYTVLSHSTGPLYLLPLTPWSQRGLSAVGSLRGAVAVVSRLEDVVGVGGGAREHLARA